MGDDRDDSKGNPHAGPWRWQGEDYRGDWGWQILVNRDGCGIIVGQDDDGGPSHLLRVGQPVEAVYCDRTGLSGKDLERARSVHVFRPAAHLIEAAPDMYEALKEAFQAIYAMQNAGDAYRTANPNHAALLERINLALRKAEVGGARMPKAVLGDLYLTPESLANAIQNQPKRVIDAEEWGKDLAARDARVLAVIQTHGRVRHANILRALGWVSEPSRALDNSLRRLRKDGKVHYAAGYWSVGK